MLNKPAGGSVCLAEDQDEGFQKLVGVGAGLEFRGERMSTRS